MELSAAGLALIKRSEGFRAETYLDVAGFLTIGYGHRLLPREAFPEGIGEEEAAEILAVDVRVATASVTRQVIVNLTQGQFDALVDFCFNLGSGRLATSTLLRDLNAGHYTDAGEQLLCWDRAAGKVNAGLLTRRQAEFELWAGTSPVVETAEAQPPFVASQDRLKTILPAASTEPAGARLAG